MRTVAGRPRYVGDDELHFVLYRSVMEPSNIYPGPNPASLTHSTAAGGYRVSYYTLYN